VKPSNEDPGWTDAEVVAAVLRGDRERFELLVRGHRRLVYSIALRMCGSPEDAEELTQEVFVRAYFALPDFKPEFRFSSWVARIASNLAIDLLRDRARTVSIEPARGQEPIAEPLLAGDASEQPEFAAEERDLRSRLWRAVADLPPEFRDIVLMRHAQELSYREICRCTGLSMGTVKSRLARARRRLGAALSRDRATVATGSHPAGLLEH